MAERGRRIVRQPATKLSPAYRVKLFPYFPHNFVNSEGRQGRWFHRQLGTPCKQDFLLVRFLRLLIGLVNNLVDCDIPILKIHRQFLCDMHLFG